MRYRSRVNVVAIASFPRCHNVFLKGIWRESICHVSLGGPIKVPKHSCVGSWLSVGDWHRISKASRTLLLISSACLRFFCTSSRVHVLLLLLSVCAPHLSLNVYRSVNTARSLFEIFPLRPHYRLITSYHFFQIHMGSTSGSNQDSHQATCQRSWDTRIQQRFERAYHSPTGKGRVSLHGGPGSRHG